MNRLALVNKAAQARSLGCDPALRDEKVTWAGMSSADRCLLGWGYGAIGLLALTWISPDSIAFFPWALSTVLGVVFCSLMVGRRATGWPRSSLFAGVLLLQMWSIVCALQAERVLGRPMVVNRGSLFWLEDLIPFFIAWLVVLQWPAAAMGIRRIALSAFLASCGVAWLQFARFGPALALSRLYTYKSIDNWDGHPGIRAVGLTQQPNHMAFQAAMALALLSAPVLWRKLTNWEFAGVLLVSGAAIFSQARIAYIGVALIWAVLIVVVIRRDRKQATWLGAIALVCLVIGVTTAMKRFDYITDLSNGTDYSRQYRENVTWAQINTIYPKLWVTGVGPSDGLLLGSGYEDKYVPVGGVMESEYFLALAMYGVPGLIFLCLTLLASLATYVVAIVRPASNPRRCMLAAAAVAVLLVAINGYSFNTIDNDLMLPCLLLFGGAACDPGRLVASRRVRASEASGR